MRGGRLALSAATALAGGGCEEAPSDATGEPRAVHLRLADLIDVAAIESPLLEIEPAASLDALDEVAVEPVFVEDFESFDPASHDWPETEVVPFEDGHALRIDGRVEGRRFWRIPAEPNTHYVFERSVRTDGALRGDFEVLEVQSVDQPLGQGRSLPRSHWIEAPPADGTWQRGSVSFFTMAYTRALILIHWETPRRFARLDPSELGDDPEVLYDDLRVARLAPTPEQSIALMKAADLAPSADPALGIRKHGQFPPFVRPAAGDVEGFSEDNYTYRYALYAPPPTSLGFELELGPLPALRFALALASRTAVGDACRFEVAWRPEGVAVDEVLWSRTLRADPAEWRWHEERVDLAPLSGQRGRLSLRTEAVRGHPHPLWGHPILEGPLRERGPRLAILIAVDTLRADRLSCYGHERETSPHLDALALDGVRFDAVASNATWTCPSFASIFTGRVPSRHGVWVAGAMWAQLPGSFETLAEHFQRAGWATRAIAYKSPLYGSGYDQGFDASLNTPTRLGRADDNLARALDWLDRDGGLRSFLFLHFDDPHEPYNLPPPFDDRYASRGDEVDRGSADEERRTEHGRDRTRNLYDGEIAYVDDRIGRFLEELRDRGLYEDTLIVFVSDHGEELWEHGQFGHGHGKLYDEGVRVPLIVKPAGREHEAGRVVPTQVSAFDVMPTLLELAGIEPPTDVQARSLVPLLSDDAPDRLAVTETIDGGLSVRTRRWKYIGRSWRQAASEEQLYDLTQDPRERTNVADRHPERVRELRLAMLDYLLQHRPGYTLVALGEGDPLEFSGVVEVQPVHGQRGRFEAGRLVYPLGSADPLRFVARVTLAGGRAALESAGGPLDPVRYEPGSLARLLREERSGVFLFRGPDPAPPDAHRREPLDPEQLEALRALGYIGR